MQTRVGFLFLTFISLFLLFLNNNAYSQDIKGQADAELNKNAVYGNIGSAVLYWTTTGYYERLIKQNMGGNSNISSFAKIGFGGYATWGIGGNFLLAQIGLLTGAKRHHFEISAGPNSYLNGDLKGFRFYSALMGYRIQKPGGNFIFRTGIGLPEALYLGLGVSF